MSIYFYRLFDRLNRTGMKKTDLLEIMSSATIAKLSKNGNVTTKTINDICNYLHCEPSDIMEYEPDKPEEQP